MTYFVFDVRITANTISIAMRTNTVKDMSKKRLRGIPVLYDQIKRTRAIRLTDTAYQAMSEAARVEGISLSELVERWARSIHQNQASR